MSAVNRVPQTHEEGVEMRVHRKALVSDVVAVGPMARGRTWLIGSLAMAVIATAPGVARGANTCNGLFTIDYVAGPNFALPGDIERVRLTLGTGSITNGSKIDITRLRFDLDCNDNFALGVPCTDEGMIVEYEGNITTTCAVAWSTSPLISATPNAV